MIHLDTSFLVDLIRETRRGEYGPATRFLEKLTDEPLAISIFVLCELQAGISKALDPRAERRRVEKIVEQLDIRTPGRQFAETYARLISELYGRRLNVDTMDLLIACAAVQDDAPLVTRNTKHFSHISSLKLLAYG